MGLLFTRAFYPFYPLLVTQSPAVAGQDRQVTQVRYNPLGLSPWSDSRTMADGALKRNCRRIRNTGRCNQSAGPVGRFIWTLDASAHVNVPFAPF